MKQKAQVIFRMKIQVKLTIFRKKEITNEIIL